MVLVHPVHDGIDHILSGHGALGGNLVAAARAVGESAGLGHSVVVIGNGCLEAGIVLGVGEGVVVNNVHDDGDARLVERLDHLLALGDSHVAVIGVRGVGALGNVVVLRVVAPVELVVGTRLVDGLEVIEGVELNGGHAQFLEIVDTGGKLALAVEGGVCLGECEELAAVFFTDTRSGVPGKVLDVQLPDGGIRLLVGNDVNIVLPACGVGLAEVANHGASAVHAGGDGINVLCFSGLQNARLGMSAGDGVGVVGVDDVTLDGGSPHTRPLVAVHQLLHRNGAELFGARLVVGARGITVERYFRSGRRPNLEYGFLGRINSAEVVAGVCVFRVKRFNGYHIGVWRCADSSVVGFRSKRRKRAGGCEHTHRKNRRNNFL